MLLDRALDLQAKLARHLELKAAATDAQIFKARATQLLPLANGLARAKADYVALRDAGLAVASVDGRPGLRAQARDLLDRFKADRAALAQADSTIRFEFTQGVQKVTQDLEAAARTAWLAYTDIESEFPSEDVLQALDAIPAYRTPVQTIRHAATRLSRLRANTPPAAEIADAVAELAAARSQKDEALTAMQGRDLPAEVLGFLKKTGQGGAALSDLTETVRAWLEARGLMGAFRIVGAGRAQ